MARKELPCKRVETYNDAFADAVNNYFFNGKEVVKVDELEDAGTVTQYDFEGNNHELNRDVAKAWWKCRNYWQLMAGKISCCRNLSP